LPFLPVSLGTFIKLLLLIKTEIYAIFSFADILPSKILISPLFVDQFAVFLIFISLITPYCCESSSSGGKDKICLVLKTKELFLINARFILLTKNSLN
jgi:hypothetical protein